MELKPPQPFKKSVAQSQTANSNRISLYTEEDLITVVAGVLTKDPGNCRLNWSSQFMCSVPGLSSTEKQSTGI